MTAVQMLQGGYSWQVLSQQPEHCVERQGVVKTQLLQACVMTVLLYVAETWTLKKQDEHKLLAFEM